MKLLLFLGCRHAPVDLRGDTDRPDLRYDSSGTTESRVDSDSPQDSDDFPALAAGTLVIQLPSAAAPDTGLALRITWPASIKRRYPEGAPVVVDLEGSWGAGDLEEDPNPALYGYISVRLLLPGGTASAGSSGGSYDFRGEQSIIAVADALQYAAGETVDRDGLSLVDHVPYALGSNLGILARSNGGNLAIATLATHGSALQAVDWLLAWESPIGDQYADGELNSNPFYIPGTCDLQTCPFTDLDSQLRFDPTIEDPLATVGGDFFLDADASGDWSAGEKLFTPITGMSDGKNYLSTELSTFIEDHAPSVYGALAPPAWFADGAARDAFWSLRDGSLRISEAHARLPQLMVMHLQNVVDHVQDLPDYPHARSHVNGWLAADQDFVRLNPDAVYMSEVTGVDAAMFTENNANTSVGWPDTAALMMGELYGVPVSTLVIYAGVLELADRSYTGNREVNLDALLWSP